MATSTDPADSDARTMAESLADRSSLWSNVGDSLITQNLDAIPAIGSSIYSSSQTNPDYRMRMAHIVISEEEALQQVLKSLHGVVESLSQRRAEYIVLPNGPTKAESHAMSVLESLAKRAKELISAVEHCKEERDWQNWLAKCKDLRLDCFQWRQQLEDCHRTRAQDRAVE
jgi:hypothetical protein